MELNWRQRVRYYNELSKEKKETGKKVFSVSKNAKESINIFLHKMSEILKNHKS